MSVIVSEAYHFNMLLCKSIKTIVHINYVVAVFLQFWGKKLHKWINTVL